MKNEDVLFRMMMMMMMMMMITRERTWLGKFLGIYLIMVEGRKGGFKVKRTFGQIEAVH